MQADILDLVILGHHGISECFWRPKNNMNPMQNDIESLSLEKHGYNNYIKNCKLLAKKHHKTYSGISPKSWIVIIIYTHSYGC